jgi:hypothetical protein
MNGPDRPHQEGVMKPMSMIFAALAAIALLGQAPAQAEPAGLQAQKVAAARRAPSPFVRYLDPYTGEVITVYRRRYLVPSNDFDGGFYAGEYAMRRAAGQCVTDLGYGRWESCK